MNLLRQRLENILLLFFALIVSVVILEMFLRIYNPFSPRIKRGEIILPKNQSYIFYSKQGDGNERRIVHTKNSMGFRGAEIPAGFDKYLSIVTVGGSTTECFCLSDDKTWPYLLGEKLSRGHDRVWLNNAGLDGQSTFGHIKLLTNYIVKIRPKIVIFLIGVNDIGRDDLNKYDKEPMCGYWSFWKRWLIKHSELASTIDTIRRTALAKKMCLAHQVVDLKCMPTLEITANKQQAEIQRHKSRYIEGYRKRLLQLVEISDVNGITPIFVTQPTLCGRQIDGSTGVDLAKVEYTKTINGELLWEIMELYNKTTKDVGDDTGALVIDLANKLPKDSRFFYDLLHYTNEGAERIAEILYADIDCYIRGVNIGAKT